MRLPSRARAPHEVHFDAAAVEPELRELHLRDGFGGEPGRELIEHRQFDPDLARQSLRARVARRPHDLAQALAVGQHRAGEHFGLHLARIELVEVDFHDQRPALR